MFIYIFVAEIQDNYYDIFIVKNDEGKEDKERTEAEIRNFVKRLLGRIVFLYFLQKKNWLAASNKKYIDGDPNFLQNLFEATKDKTNFYREVLSNLFFNTLNKIRENDSYTLQSGEKKCIPFLNGGLFEEEHEPEKHGNIKFPEYRFRELFNFFNSYNFTIYENSPEENTVAVDPEMLGHIFENLLEDNKDKGAYYTPKEIVHYMTQQSLVEYLTTHIEIDRDKIEILIVKNISEELKDKDLEKIEKLVDNVRICDPAIGSGAFPMGLLQEIFSLKALINYELQRTDWNPAKVKQDIIQNSIYGVDIESGAVDIARLRFWLSLVVDEDVPQPLPNLDYKIMQGDSLVEYYEGINLGNISKGNDLQIAEMQTDLFGNFIDDQMQITVTKSGLAEEIQNLIELYFNAKADKKQEIKAEINKKVHDHIDYNLELRQNQIERQILEIEVVRTLNARQQKHLSNLKLDLEKLNISRNKLHKLLNSYEKPFFLWQLFFADVFNEGGFDIVIGNPPYIQLQKGSGRLSQILGNLGYETFTRTGDIFEVFYEKGWQILKDKGILCYITSNKWMRAAHGELTRKFFAEKTNPLILIDFAGQKIFESATVDTNILLFSKDKNRQLTRACIVKEKVLNNLSDYFRQNATVSPFLTSNNWTILSQTEKSIRDKIESAGVPLKDWDISINYGIKTGFNEAFIIDGKKRKELINEDSKSEEIIRPLLRGRDIKRYFYEFADLYLIATFPSKKYNIDDYPAVKKFLIGFEPKLKQTGTKLTQTEIQSVIQHAKNNGIIVKEDSLQISRKKTTNKWFETQDSISYWEDFYRQKIVWLELTDKPKFSIDLENRFCLAGTFLLTGDFGLYTILAVLNSKLIEWLFDGMCNSSGVGTNQWKKFVVEKISIPIIDEETEQKVQKLISSNDYENLEIFIHKLYGLTKAESQFINFL